MERIGQANVSSERSVRLTLDNLTVPRFAKKRLGSASRVVVFFLVFSERRTEGWKGGRWWKGEGGVEGQKMFFSSNFT